MCGFKHSNTAARFCRVYDEVRSFLRPQKRHNQRLALTQRRRIHQERVAQLMGLMAAA
jgi:putative transposase